MTKPVLIVHVPLYQGLPAVDTSQEPGRFEVMVFEVTDSITRMTDLCRALGILEAWQTAACLEGEALVRANTIRLGRVRLDATARTVNGVPLAGRPPADLDREMHEIQKVKAVCELRWAVAFVAKTRPVWIRASADDTLAQAAA